MKNIYYTLTSLLLLLNSLIVLSGCKGDAGRTEELSREEADLFVSLRLDHTDGETIDAVRVIVFNEKLGCTANRRFSKEEYMNATGDKPAETARLTTLVGKSTVYVVVNETLYLTAKLNTLDASSMKAQLSDLLTAEETTFQPSPAYIFSGVAETTIAKTSIPQHVNIDLKRSRAKLTLSFRLAEETVPADAEVTINSVELVRGITQGRLFGLDALTIDCSSFNATLTKDLVLTSTYQPFLGMVGAADHSCYLNENIFKKAINPVAISVTDTMNNAPYLLVRATFNGVPTAYAPVYIKDIHTRLNGTGIAAADNPYNILRNEHYHIGIQVKHIGAVNGLQLQAEVLPWNVQELCQDFGATDFNLIVDEQSKPMEYILQDDGTAKVVWGKFVLHTPIGASWRVTQTNGLDFKLNGQISGFQGQGQKTFTISMNPLPVGVASRETEIYFIVNGQEMSYDGVGVGTGHRLKIKLIKE